MDSTIRRYDNNTKSSDKFVVVAAAAAAAVDGGGVVKDDGYIHSSTAVADVAVDTTSLSIYIVDVFFFSKISNQS